MCGRHGGQGYGLIGGYFGRDQCHACKGYGHWRRNCPYRNYPEEYDFGPGHLEKIMDKKDHTNTKGGWKKKMGSSKKKDWIGLN
ncbi:hypothetical protein D4764_0274390 [Takifugu flavidus]|uniref:CCHC-type domain-containing protein n=1 Tax=Takifugu flavidus TaxID=433684 RepID=A0A5C6MJ46_9TELE|nr:hypothetical protein D4764_0274390 [Takifugu flavidus]